MLKMDDKKKCSEIEYADEYGALMYGANNPYGYNFGKVIKSQNLSNYSKLQHKVNPNFFAKK